jgi:hypothetical protein
MQTAQRPIHFPNETTSPLGRTSRRKKGGTHLRAIGNADLSHSADSIARRKTQSIEKNAKSMSPSSDSPSTAHVMLTLGHDIIIANGPAPIAAIRKKLRTLSAACAA